MLSVSATAFRKDLFHLLSNTARYNSEFTVSTKEGNVVVLSEQDYRNLTETVYLSSSPQTKKEIEEGLRAREEDCVPASEVTW
jgi:antitoxin YefM